MHLLLLNCPISGAHACHVMRDTMHLHDVMKRNECMHLKCMHVGRGRDRQGGLPILWNMGPLATQRTFLGAFFDHA